MKIDIQYYIKQVLREQRKVYIPNVGTFGLLQSSAYISDDKSRIYPPTLDIKFSTGTSDDLSLKKYIQDTNKFSDEHIDSSIAGYTESIVNNLIDKKVNSIEGLGLLVRDKEIDKVFFEPSFESFTKEFKNLQSLSIDPIVRIKDDVAVDHVINTQSQAVRAENKFRWLQPIVAGILIAALFIFVRSCSQTDSMEYIKSDESSDALDENYGNEVADTIYDGDENRTQKLDQKYKEVDKILDEASITTDQDGESDNKSGQLANGMHLDSKVDHKVDEEYLDEKGGGLDKVDNEMSVAKKSTVPENKYADLIPQSGNCIIVLGSFKKASNITRMISLIEQDGKRVYTSQYNGKTRVGFSFDCSNVDLDAYLNEIRDHLSAKAWYLDPTLAIPYK